MQRKGRDCVTWREYLPLTEQRKTLLRFRFPHNHKHTPHWVKVSFHCARERWWVDMSGGPTASFADPYDLSLSLSDIAFSNNGGNYCRKRPERYKNFLECSFDFERNTFPNRKCVVSFFYAHSVLTCESLRKHLNWLSLFTQFPGNLTPGG